MEPLAREELLGTARELPAHIFDTADQLPWLALAEASAENAGALRRAPVFERRNPMDNCPVCELNAVLKPAGLTDNLQVRCDNCGRFEITKEARANLASDLARDPDKKWLLAHAIREATSSGGWFVIGSEFVDAVMKNGRFPAAAEQVDNLVLSLGQSAPGEWHVLAFDHFQAIIGAVDVRGYSWVIRAAHSRGYLEGSLNEDFDYDEKGSFSKHH